MNASIIIAHSISFMEYLADYTAYAMNFMREYEYYSRLFRRQFVPKRLDRRL